MTWSRGSRRAARQQRSLEQELREILSEAARPSGEAADQRLLARLSGSHFEALAEPL